MRAAIGACFPHLFIKYGASSAEKYTISKLYFDNISFYILPRLSITFSQACLIEIAFFLFRS